MVEKRFVFLVSKPSEEVLDGTTVEIRAESPEAAIAQVQRWAWVKNGATMTLIGERRGFRSSLTFFSLVPREELPAHVQQNEKVYVAPAVSWRSAG